MGKGDKLISTFDFDIFLSPILNNTINVTAANKETVDISKERCEKELEEANKKLEETIKGFNAKPELVKITFNDLIHFSYIFKIIL